MFAILHRYYGGMHNLQLTPKSQEQIVQTYQIVLDKVISMSHSVLGA